MRGCCPSALTGEFRPKPLCGTISAGDAPFLDLHLRPLPAERIRTSRCGNECDALRRLANRTKGIRQLRKYSSLHFSRSFYFRRRFVSQKIPVPFPPLPVSRSLPDTREDKVPFPAPPSSSLPSLVRLLSSRVPIPPPSSPHPFLFGLVPEIPPGVDRPLRTFASTAFFGSFADPFFAASVLMCHSSPTASITHFFFCRSLFFLGFSSGTVRTDQAFFFDPFLAFSPCQVELYIPKR